MGLQGHGFVGLRARRDAGSHLMQCPPGNLALSGEVGHRIEQLTQRHPFDGPAAVANHEVTRHNGSPGKRLSNSYATS